MSESSELRDRAIKCRRMATSVDHLTQNRLTILASEYDARALRIEDDIEDHGGHAR